MVDFESMLAYLQARTERKKFIPSSHNYTLEDCEALHKIREFAPSEFDTLYFYDTDSLFLFTWKCSGCLQISAMETNLTSFKEHIKNFGIQEIYCEKCKEEQKIIREQQEQKRNLDLISKKKENTSKFISLYLTPDANPIKKRTAYQQLSQIQSDYFSSEREDIITYIKGMNYRDFLKTAYWKAIANYCKYRSKYICSLCYSDKNLIAHHKTYEHHGEEIEYYHIDIICLCDSCHSKFHEVKK